MLNWDYWLNSGEWLPWAIRTSIVTVLFLFAVNPGWGLWIKRKLNPVWPDGTPMGLGFAWSWRRAGWKGKIRKAQDKCPPS